MWRSREERKKRENEILLSVRKGQSFNSVPGHRLTVVFYSVTLRRIDSFSHSLLLILSFSFFSLLLYSGHFLSSSTLIWEKFTSSFFPFSTNLSLLGVQTFPSFFSRVLMSEWCYFQILPCTVITLIRCITPLCFSLPDSVKNLSMKLKTNGKNRNESNGKSQQD